MTDEAERRQTKEDQQGGIEHERKSLPKKSKPAYFTRNRVNKQAFCSGD
jgi:hypothetical protein